MTTSQAGFFSPIAMVNNNYKGNNPMNPEELKPIPLVEQHQRMPQPNNPFQGHYVVCETHCFNVDGTELEIVHDQKPIAITYDPNTAYRYERIPPRPIHTEILGANFCTIRYRVIHWGDNEYIQYLTSLATQAQKETANP